MLRKLTLLLVMVAALFLASPAFGERRPDPTPGSKTPVHMLHRLGTVLCLPVGRPAYCGFVSLASLNRVALVATRG